MKTTTSTYPLKYTQNVFVHADKTVHNSEGTFLGQYVGCELDNFSSELSASTFCPETSDGFGFYVVYMFLKKNGKYYEVNWSGKLKEISFFQLSLSRLKSRRCKRNFKFLSLIPHIFKLRSA